MMRKLAKLRKDEAGYALVWVLVLLIVSGLLLIPLLLLMTTGLTASDIREESTQRFYAADAGIEDGTYRALHSMGLPANVGQEVEYPSFQLNDSTVDVTIYKAEEATYKITSTSTDNGSGKTTAIESYVFITIADFSGFLDNAITSGGDITIQPGSMVYGDVQYDGDPPIDEEQVDGEIITDPVEYWPTAEQLSECYLSQVDVVEDVYLSDTIDLKYWGTSIGPLYRDGDLTIKNTGSSDWVELAGNIYVTGNLYVQQDSEIRLDDGDDEHTIFAEGEIDISPQSTIAGSGCIIAVGDIWFYPHISSDPDDFVFIMSIEGTVRFQPGDDFYGAVAGDIEVELQPNCTLRWRGLGAGEELNFPTEVTVDLEVITYTIE